MNPTIDAKHYIEPDVLLVHKPIGITSFDVIRKLRPLLATRKIGHAGTLDPLAHGLMIVGINKGTKKLSGYLKLPKTYIAEVLLGRSTTTGDLEGDIVAEKYVEKVDMKKVDIEQAVDSLVGTHLLKVPLYSAIKVEGKALYRYAREGTTPPYIPEKEMTITHIQVLDDYRSNTGHIIKVRLDVSSGTYIRSLGELLGQKMGYPATLRTLYRVAIGEYYDKDAYHFPQPRSPRPTWIRAILGVLTGKR